MRPKTGSLVTKSSTKRGCACWTGRAQGVPDALHYQAVKAQANDGSGANFPLHFDTDTSLDDRKLTALFYLNEGWEAAHGGELLLHPAPSPCAPPEAAVRQAVVVEPRAGRLVLFSAAEMLHRVLPSWAPRYCFTVWLFTRHLPREAAGVGARAAEGGGQGALEAMLRPRLRKYFLRALFADEWAESFLASHPESEARDRWVDEHWKEVALLEGILEREAPGARKVVDDLRGAPVATIRV